MNELCGTRRQIKRLLGLRDDKCKISAYVETFLKEKDITKSQMKDRFAMKKYSKSAKNLYLKTLLLEEYKYVMSLNPLTVVSINRN